MRVGPATDLALSSRGQVGEVVVRTIKSPGQPVPRREL
jgi:hypothetical protein